MEYEKCMKVFALVDILKDLAKYSPLHYDIKTDVGSFLITIGELDAFKSIRKDITFKVVVTDDYLEISNITISKVEHLHLFSNIIKKTTDNKIIKIV